MHHYVYLLTFDNGMGYIGAHSTKIEPELDTCYLGSGKALPSRSPQTCTKQIIKTFDSRREAILYEEQLILLNDAVASEYFYNLRSHVHDRHGCKLSETHVALIRETQKGRSRPEFSKKYIGEGRTPAQRAGAVAAGMKIKGTKNPKKGKASIANNGFHPWYYISPLGEYVEIHDKTKEELAPMLGFTSRQLGHGFHYTNEHKQARTPPRKGWVFGNLPRPSGMAKD